MIVLAHAFGERYDLPIPLVFFVLGGAFVVIASFVLVFRETSEPRVGPDEDVPHLKPWVGFWSPASFGLLIGLILCGLLGNQDVLLNIVPTAFWVTAWIAVPLSVGALGDWTGPVNAFGWLSRWADSDRWRQRILGDRRPLPWPGWLGWWPAVTLYFLIACGELIFNLEATIPENTAIGLIVYAIVCVVGGLLFGRSWLNHGEIFTVLFDTWGRLGYFRFGAAGTRGFARGMVVQFAPKASRIAFVLLLLFSVNFDGLLATPDWARVERSFPGQLESHAGSLHAFLTVSFIALALILGTIFALFAAASARAGEHRRGLRQAMSGLLPSLLPIAFGYLLAHNLQYVLINGQLLVTLIGNPPGTAGWPIHLPYPFNSQFLPNPKILPAAFFWYLSISVIIAVHVIAVRLAHRQLAATDTSRSAARRSEYSWLVAMVCYTMFSLWLIAQPLTRTTSTTSVATPTARPSILGGRPEWVAAADVAPGSRRWRPGLVARP